MPIYRYECNKCGKIMEEIRNQDVNKLCCSYCDGTARRIMSTTNFKVNGYNAKNFYTKTPKDEFIEQGPYDYERNLKKQGKRTAHEIMNG